MVRFEVIDPPSVSLTPVAPNRPLLIALVLVLGIGAGGALAFLLNQTRPVFDNVRSLAELTALPVLGAVSRIWRERHRQQRRREVLQVATAGAALFGVFLVVLVLQSPVSRMCHGLVS